MLNKKRFADLTLHDANVAGMKMVGDDLVMEFDSVTNWGDEYFKVKFVCKYVSNISRAYEDVKIVSMESDDGTVLEFDWNDRNATLVVEWFDHKTRISDTIRHQISYKACSVFLMPCDPP